MTPLDREAFLSRLYGSIGVNLRPMIDKSEHTAHYATVAFRDALRERMRQLDKWGAQSHPSVPAEYAETPQARQTFEAIAAELERAAKADCNFAFKRGKGTWYHIAWEELAEVGAAPPEKRREELVQLTAVCLAWLEDLDSKAAARAQTPTEDSKP